MGLPTNIPSGGDGLGEFGGPLPALDDPTEELPRSAQEKERAEYEAFLQWRRSQQAGGEQQQSAERAPQTKSGPQERRRAQGNRVARPRIESKPVSRPIDVVEQRAKSTVGLSQRVDPKTGKSYFEIPRTRMGDDGRPVLAMDIDIDDLNGEAENFLAHLRVPPSPEEKAAILKRRAELRKKQEDDRKRLDMEIEEKEGALDEPEANPFDEKPKKRGLFGRKS